MDCLDGKAVADCYYKKGYRAGVEAMREAVQGRAYGDDYGDVYILPEDVDEEATRLIAEL